MRDVNKVILVGRLGADPKGQTFDKGMKFASFPVATRRDEETQWHRVSVFGKQAENCSAYLKKGEGVYVEGRIRSRQYVGQDGQKRSISEVLADSVHFLGRRTRGLQAQNPQVQELASDSPLEMTSEGSQSVESIVPEAVC